VIDTAAVTVTQTADATFENQASGGNSVTVDSVYVPDGGFVTIHDSSVAEGAVFDSVRGTSTYLEPGLHRDVTVALDQPVEDDTTLVAMPHRDTNDNEKYDFVDSSGEDDGPYTDRSGAVTDNADIAVSAAVTVTDQQTDGTTVVVDRVDMSEGGFVALHDATLFDGEVLGSVIGHSEYLEAGVHENVEITLNERHTSGETIVAMPHRDTDGDEAYTFVESEGEADGPYTAAGGAVVDTASTTVEASIAFSEQTTSGETITVDSVTLQDGGFVTVHDATVTEGAVFDSIRGTSAYLGPGTHEDVEITLDQPIEEDTTLVPMAHRDTDGDEAYTFAESEGAADGPYLGGNGAVVAVADVTFESIDDSTEMDENDEEMTDEGMDDDEMTEETTDEQMDQETTGGSGPGFGVVAALGALLLAAFVARRR
jgi:PGF-CTERM protein